MLVPYRKPELKTGMDYNLTISFHQKGKTDWADAGYEIAWDQFRMPWSIEEKPSISQFAGSLTVNEEKDRISITGKNFVYVFNKNSGVITSMKINGKEMLSRGGELNLWRAPLANETDEWGFWSANKKHRTDGMGRMAATEWYSAGLDKTNLIMESFSFETTGTNNVNSGCEEYNSVGNRKKFLQKSLYIHN